MYRLRTVIEDGKILVNSAQYAYAENKLTYSVLDSAFDVRIRVNKADIDVIKTKFHEDCIAIAPYYVWTFNPDEAKEALISRVKSQIQERIDYVNTIKHLI